MTNLKNRINMQILVVFPDARAWLMVKLYFIYERKKSFQNSLKVQYDLTFLPERSTYFTIPRIVRNVQDLSIFFPIKNVH